MALKPEYSVMGGLAVGAVVLSLHQQATPSQADIQSLPAGVGAIDKAERHATVMSVGVVAGISLLAKDPTIFMIGSAITIGMALWTRHSNHSDPAMGKVLSPSESAQAGSANSGPAMETTAPYQMFDSGSEFRS